MELEHLFQSTTGFTVFQMLFMSSMLMPGALGRMDIYRSFVRSTASAVVTFGPISLLGYILYQVSQIG